MDVKFNNEQTIENNFSTNLLSNQRNLNNSFFNQNDFSSVQNNENTEVILNNTDNSKLPRLIDFEDNETEKSTTLKDLKKEQTEELRKQFKSWLKEDAIKNAIRSQEMQEKEKLKELDEKLFLKKLAKILVLRKQIEKLKMEKAILSSNKNSSTQEQVKDIDKKIGFLKGKLDQVKTETETSDQIQGE